MITPILHSNECEFLIHGAEHRTHVDGHWYEKPRKFPCVLHDKNGCLFLTKEKYHELTKSGVFLENQHLNVGGAQKGISKILGYKVCSLKDECPKYNPKKIGGTSKKRNQSSASVPKGFTLFHRLPLEQQRELLATLSEMYKH